MSTDSTRPVHFRCQSTRRELVWQMGAGFAGVALSGLMDSQGWSPPGLNAAETTTNPLAPRPPQLPTRIKSCIFLMMNGAPSQVDTFDYKPELEKHSGKQLPADKQYINSGGRKVGYLTPAWRQFRPGGDSGLLISDYFPCQNSPLIFPCCPMIHSVPSFRRASG